MSSEHNEKYDFRVFKTITGRIGFSVPIGFVMAFICGGWVVWDVRFTPLMSTTQRVSDFAEYGFLCAAMVWGVTWLVDYNSKGGDHERP